MRLLLLCFLCCVIFNDAIAQHTFDEKMKWYDLAKPTTNLFVHYDKNIYSNNETVYFTGYLIKEGRTPNAQHKVMAVALVRDVDSVIISDHKFIMKSGISFGSITLPDSIPTGNYHFLAYTDKLINQMPEVLFKQHITIKSNKDPYIKASLKLMEQPKPETKFLKVLVSALSRDDRFLAKPAQVSYRYGGIRKTTSTDASGQALINLPLNINISDANLYVKVKYEQDSTFINFTIPQPKYKAVVKFYPEGGNMVNGLNSNIGWEVKDLQNRPLELKAYLFKDSQVLDTIETSRYGIGKFMLIPEVGASYSIKLVDPYLVDSTYQLPQAIHNGLTLMTDNVLVKDTLFANLKTNERSKLWLLVHNFKTTFLAIPLQVTHQSVRLKIALDQVPKGLTTLTIIDSLNRPLAERIFFAHYSNEPKISLSTDKIQYKPREKVSLKLNLAAEGDALVSIAAVQNSRMEIKKMTDIESYTFLNNELNALFPHPKGIAYQDPDYLEQMLLVKGWRRYTWQGLLESKPIDTLFVRDSLGISGQVTLYKKQKKASDITIGTMGSLGINIINTTNGAFHLDQEHLTTLPDKKMYVFVNKVQEPPYDKITIDDGFSTLNQKLIKLKVDQPLLFPPILNNNSLVLKNNEKMIRLNEVVISSKDRGFNFSGPNGCGDYVCPYNILNCRNHVWDAKNTLPVKGGSYIASSGTRVRVIYGGCNIPDRNLFTLVKGIHLEKEFYHNDYKDPNEPAFFSTIYWNYGTFLKTNEETELSFYCSDITGKFRVVVQGITDNNVIYAEHFFEVK